MASHTRTARIEAFGFQPGRIVARKYEIVCPLGAGWEGEVYKIRERATGIEMAAKFFFPHRNPKDRISIYYAKKLHRLRHCPIVIQYHNQEQIMFRGEPVTFLVSDYVEGQLLSQFLSSQPGRRISAFQALHLLHALAQGIECLHKKREYHGDLHAENIIVSRYGLGFELKLVDMFYWGRTRSENLQDDLCDLIRLFYDALGGKRHYAKQPRVVKEICLGLKRSLITKKFRSVAALREHIERLEW